MDQFWLTNVTRFIESLGAKVYQEPPTIEKLSEIFQDFYIKANSNISTHISTLSSRLNGDASPTRPKPPVKAKTIGRQSSRDATDVSEQTGGSQQMLTASEVTQRRRARKMLQYKRVALEEAVERRVCEQVYTKIFRHKTTQDEARDEKLRSKTAALALVGIGLKDLGIELAKGSGDSEDDVRDSLAPAREGLAKMNDEKHPLGKLQHLTTAHKSIVDTLSTIHSSTASADEILPTLIYTLITTPFEGINIVSNLYFIQRFRATGKQDGEAGYCMTNLEAAIDFLENVDLSSLRDDEVPEGPPKAGSRPATPTVERPDPFPSFTLDKPPSAGRSTTAMTSSNISATSLQAPPLTKSRSSSQLPSPSHQRRLSNLLNPPVKVMKGANDAMRNTAEDGFKNISNTLDNSFKFLFGRLKERSNEDDAHVLLPKTLDEARQLVNQPRMPEDESMISETSSIAEKDADSPRHNSGSEDKLLGLVGGRKAASIRERSADSVQSTGSNKRVAFAATPSTLSQPSPPAPGAQPAPPETVKSIGNSMNPLNAIGSAFGGGFRSFSKAISTPPTVSAERDTAKPMGEAISVQKATVGDSIKIEAPVQRFIAMKDAGELQLKDVPELLGDYQRLAKAIKDLGRG